MRRVSNQSGLDRPVCLPSRHQDNNNNFRRASLIAAKKKKENHKKLLGRNYFSYFVNRSFGRLHELLVNHCLLLSLHYFPFWLCPFAKAAFAFVLLSFRAPMLLWTWGWLMLRTHYHKDSHLWKRPRTPVRKLALLLFLWVFFGWCLCLFFFSFFLFCVRLRPRSSEAALLEIKNVLWAQVNLIYGRRWE